MTIPSHTPTIFYPCRLDLEAPIQSIHREVAMRLSDSYRFSGFVEHTVRRELSGFYRTTQVNSERWKISKGAIYLREYLRGHDIVHTGPGGRKNHPILVRLAKQRGTQLVHTHHTVTPGDLKLQKWLASNADIVTAVSPFVEKWAQEKLGRNDVIMIPNGVNLDQFHPDLAQTDSDMVLFIGRLVKRKNPQLVIDLAERYPELHFVIRGDGPLRSRIEERAPDNISLTARLPDTELAKLYCRASVLLCPFEREGFGMVVLESMATGTPVIGLKSGNLPNLITDTSGNLCKGLDIGDWDRCLQEVRRKRDQYDPRARALEFSWSTVADQYKMIYDQVLNHGANERN